jgi:hypothetical protein
MKDITAIEVQKITLLVNESIPFGIAKYPYLNSYGELNNAILEKARNGESSINFDFVDTEQSDNKTLEEIKQNASKIYPHYGVCYALNNTYDHPNYLLSRQKTHRKLS